MLYLNSSCINIAAFIISHLTLTNVVFELQRLSEQYTPDYYLTLTNVVFESDNINNFQRIAIFNFNKCCI